MARINKKEVYDSPAYLRFKQQPFFAAWTKAAEEQGIDINEALVNYEPRFWVFCIEWRKTPEGFDYWDHHNANWVKSFK